MSAVVLVQFALGLVLLIVGAEFLVRGASKLAAAAGISPLVIGLTVVAFGTSSPELAVSIQSAFQGQGDIALGNVVGSNIFNVLFILGVSAVIIPLIVHQQLVRLDIPLLIGVSAVTYLFALDGSLARWEGGLLFAGLLTYIIFLIRQSRQAGNDGTDVDGIDVRPPQSLMDWFTNLAMIVGGLAMLVYGSDLLVESAVAIATFLGLSELVIGLTIIAAGTSLPEVATSIIAAVRGERDIAVGNVVGSNLFNLMGVLGLTALVTPTSIPVASAAITLDLPFMLIVAVACLPIFCTGNLIARWEGLVFLAYYVAYTAYLVLRTGQPSQAPMVIDVVLYFLTPLMLITIAGTVMRELRSRRAHP